VKNSPRYIYDTLDYIVSTHNRNGSIYLLPHSKEYGNL